MSEETTPTLLEARVAEVEQYEANILMYTDLKASLPTEWPERLIEYRNTKNQHEAAAKVTDLADVELLSKLWFVDECDAAIRSETVEMTKAKAILGIMQG